MRIQQEAHDNRSPHKSERPKLRRMIQGNPEDAPRQSPNWNNTPLGEIRTIVEGFTGSGPTSSNRKAHARRARYKEPNYTTQRILVDNGSLTDVLSWDAFTKMGIDPSQLRPSPIPLKGFSRDAIPHVGMITLPMSARKGPYTATTMTNLLVIKAPSSYNVIPRHPTLNHLKAIISTYHLKMKFLIEAGVGQVHSEQL
ncbi:hypothetical protein I3842_13G142200 [Carya illinoinensis]|uniref:Uncharacterized protein n=1 Tax=Carya illinoinensis TaxID=32201 RepID=A0A922APQ6_CARIL|nr:hypothetical protein I3842_13G142200 [Carya illinoinensis]